ncbi:hypothetical protein V8C26DRAFT_241332 [Trichoderma gracile]
MVHDETHATAEAESRTGLNMTELLESLSESVDIALSKEGRDFEENNLHKFLAELDKEEAAAYDLLGMPCARVVITGSQLRIQPRQKPSLQVAEYPEIGDDINTEYFSLSRETPPGQHSESTTYKVAGKELVGADFKIVFKAEVAALEA